MRGISMRIKCNSTGLTLQDTESEVSFIFQSDGESSFVTEVGCDYNVTHEHPLLHHPEQTIPEDPQTPLWIRGNEIHHSNA